MNFPNNSDSSGLSSEFQQFITNSMNQTSEQLQAMQRALAEKDEMIRQLLKLGKMQLADQQGNSSEGPQVGTHSAPKSGLPISENTPPNKGKSVKRAVSGPSKLNNPKGASKGNTGTPTRSNNKRRESTPKTVTPKKPNQVLALYAHIKILWGLTEKRPIPPAPQPDILQEFYHQFSDSHQIKNVVNNVNSPAMVPKDQIETLKDMVSGRKNIASGIVHVEEQFIDYARTCLARMGLRVWGPNLDETQDSLLNSACRISAVSTFRQVAAVGAYDFMSINKTYLNEFNLLYQCYNHYVHHVMLERFKKEQKEGGKYHAEEEKKAIQKARERLRDARYKFAVEHDFPPRYQKIIGDIHSHSNDEYNAKNKVYVIKTLPFRSKTANTFFCRLDKVMIDTNLVRGKRSQQRRRALPTKPQPTVFPRAPKRLPLDFYDPEWFNELQPNIKDIVADTNSVAFFPEPANILRGNRHADEKLSDKRFTEKYWDKVTSKYNLDHIINNEDDNSSDDEDNDDASYHGNEIDLANTSGEEEEEPDEQEEDVAFIDDQEPQAGPSNTNHEDSSDDDGAYDNNNKMLVDDDNVAFANTWAA
ncbi:uncharacterized protein PGTG_16004 [Puccinia graminis f. sp. tritici CRL 75-36-700-3]|uniref:Uncharacterized protein n=1 Tax=Puccinia graminis f. sp. tritici (strain CRL 75-36-700-3 / race SCCL) TaxID=418459 RepID=E3L0M8_PUCGT|nr:uncharacterized protein PGTG_16004 [Puccinia graminis f. sp. tritici CRL 75-36-700-3]EFP90156.2 hypothetical protein PGTG_16004 [Puccinia graminis f. sp. tritici CRL 75-36-700-3]